jgi:hypothetical protein
VLAHPLLCTGAFVVERIVGVRVGVFVAAAFFVGALVGLRVGVRVGSREVGGEELPVVGALVTLTEEGARVVGALEGIGTPEAEIAMSAQFQNVSG